MKKIFKNSLPELALIIIAFLIGTGVAYAVGTTAGVFRNIIGIGAQAQITPLSGDSCKTITSAITKEFLVPTKTTAEWNAFLAHGPISAPTSCCAGNMGTSCNANACGTYGGTIMCNGSCSGGVPATPYTVGTNCNPNACGTYGGTINNACTGTCSGGVPGTPYTVGANCNLNACGTPGGTITNACTGACSGGVPGTPYTVGTNCNLNACGTPGGTINNACTGACSGGVPATP